MTVRHLLAACWALRSAHRASACRAAHSCFPHVTMVSCPLRGAQTPLLQHAKGQTKSPNPCPPGAAQVYIYSESYGGKMAAQFALAIHRAQQKRHIYLTFRSALHEIQ